MIHRAKANHYLSASMIPHPPDDGKPGRLPETGPAAGAGPHDPPSPPRLDTDEDPRSVLDRLAALEHDALCSLAVESRVRDLEAEVDLLRTRPAWPAHGQGAEW